MLHRLSIGAGSPTPTLFHLLHSKNVLLLSSSLSPAYAPAVFTCTLPLCKVFLGLLRYCTNPKLLHLQRRNPGFIKLNLTQRRTAREINFKMFPLKSTVSKLCTVYRNQRFFNEKAIPPSRGLRSEAPKGQAGQKPRLDMQPLLSPLCPERAQSTTQLWLYNLSFSFRSPPYVHFPGINDYEFKAVTVL